MKRSLSLILLIGCINFLVGWVSNDTKQPVWNKTTQWVIQELESCQSQLTLMLNVEKLKTLKKYYHAARKHLKHTEFYTEYCSPREMKYFINGPLVPKHDPDKGSVMFPPNGFQRIEELIFGSEQPTDLIILKKELSSLIEQISLCINYYKTLTLDDGRLLEMCQLQCLRISSLTLNGYDATITQTNITECAWSVEGMQTTVELFSSFIKGFEAIKIFEALKKQLTLSKKTLLKNTNYATFNRLGFITNYINPLNKLLINFHNSTRLEWDSRNMAINLKYPFLFGKNSFNIQYFSIYYDDTLSNQAQAILGERLFYDQTLSLNNKRSCSTCHNPKKAFSDGFTRSKSLNKNVEELRNAPTLLNVAYQKAFFYDGKAYQLEQQVFDVVHNKKEMGGNLEEIVIQLRNQTSYRKYFREAFAGTQDTAITPYAIQKAIAEYEKKLISFNSRFDKYLEGDPTALNNREINGYNLFAGKALCGSCHFLPLFNGTVPPTFSDSEFEVIGVPDNADNKKPDTDPGRFAVTGIPEHQNSFKTPTIRNIAVTAPYMHNGVYKTLAEVVGFYHRGGGNGFGFNIQNQTLPFDTLILNEAEKQDIILFMHTLTDTSISKKNY